jgi:hypothetical protein
MKITLSISFELNSTNGLFYDSLIKEYVDFEPTTYFFGNKQKEWKDGSSREEIANAGYSETLSVIGKDGRFSSNNTLASSLPHRSIHIIKKKEHWNLSGPEISMIINYPGFVAGYMYDELYVNQQSISGKSMLEFYGVPRKVIKKMKLKGVIGGEEMFDISENPGRKI